MVSTSCSLATGGEANEEDFDTRLTGRGSFSFCLSSHSFFRVGQSVPGYRLPDPITYQAGPVEGCGLLGTTSRSNAAEARPLVRDGVGELLSAHRELKIPSKTEQLVRHSALESAAGTPPGLTWSPWAVRQQCSSHSQTCSQRASRSKCPLRKLFPIVLRGARCRSHRRTRALLRSVTSLHCRLGVCRE